MRVWVFLDIRSYQLGSEWLITLWCQTLGICLSFHLQTLPHSYVNPVPTAYSLGVTSEQLYSQVPTFLPAVIIKQDEISVGFFFFFLSLPTPMVWETRGQSSSRSVRLGSREVNAAAQPTVSSNKCSTTQKVGLPTASMHMLLSAHPELCVLSGSQSSQVGNKYQPLHILQVNPGALKQFLVKFQIMYFVLVAH